MGLLTGPLPLIPPSASSANSQQAKGPTVVALGGGHGLSASLSALRLLSSELTAVVTVADDGGSSGRLREEYGVLPPGDLRMALSALCDDTDWGRTWRDVMQHRFAPGKPNATTGQRASLDQHAMGNLLIVTLWELLGDAVDGLRWAGALLGARGQVLPMSTVPLTIEGDVLVTAPDGSSATQTISGQARCAVAGKLERVRLMPAEAPACIEALTAIELADWVILGPGSWYTSVLPHLLLPEMQQALCDTPAKRCLTMNLATDTQETTGMSAADHLHALRKYAPNFGVDVVLADPRSITDRAEFREAAGMLGARVVLANVGAAGHAAVHDPLRLATAYHDIFGNG
ncbi:uridine diphosphate-N-acetylglucosamine-binding protein YvcK [Pseudarthrobacter sp. PS3-L1]|uniref:gluconeogenesis factor YvcK family protein n=1 Tax=Pseudarthrobacter sp. PS3-L1 TaxID=3046207 RepID=UPI0024BA381B|nr:uridine diphosphate-N-acetylglucosamine-binding protein YvcK [Pseudarthrobacter sp. PS3-L1]MDJ0320226.1 uridine diphosphate-N-acetylglucosamine-binding protein YvcK [Pseudarthrobacter sp. PS3-L1]